MNLILIAFGYFMLGWAVFLVGYWWLVVVHPEKLTESLRDKIEGLDIVSFIAVAVIFSVLWAPVWVIDAIKSRRKKCSKEQ